VFRFRFTLGALEDDDEKADPFPAFIAAENRGCVGGAFMPL